LSSKGITGTIDIIERLGETGYAHVRLPDNQVIVVEVRGEPPRREGGEVSVAINPSQLHVFDVIGLRIN
jgi:ABC-type sugar transport system ATPase subunit